MKFVDKFKTERRCVNCETQDSRFFCSFSPTTLEAFDRIKVTKTFPKGSRLFSEGQLSEGVFVVCQGRVKLTTHSQTGKALILRIAIPGEVIGISAAMNGGVYETTAEVIDTAQLNFVSTADFKRFLERFPDAGMNAINALCREYKIAYTQIRSLGLAGCVGDKLALLLLEWSKGGISNNGSVHMTISFSHEAIAEMIGTTRETVTRLLKDFRQRDLIAINGSDLYIPDKRKLEATIGNGKRSRPSIESTWKGPSETEYLATSHNGIYHQNGDDAHILNDKRVLE